MPERNDTEYSLYIHTVSAQILDRALVQHGRENLTTRVAARRAFLTLRSGFIAVSEDFCPADNPSRRGLSFRTDRRFTPSTMFSRRLTAARADRSNARNCATKKRTYATAKGTTTTARTQWRYYATVAVSCGRDARNSREINAGGRINRDLHARGDLLSRVRAIIRRIPRTALRLDERRN